MYRPYMNEQQQKQHNDDYASQVARQLNQAVCNSISNILSQNNDYASERNEKEVIRFLESVKRDFIADIDITSENLQAQYWQERK